MSPPPMPYPPRPPGAPPAPASPPIFCLDQSGISYAGNPAWCFDQFGFGAVLFGMIGSCCTIIGLMQILQWAKEQLHYRMLQDVGVRVVGRLVRKWTFIRKRVKGKRECVHCIEAQFRTADGQSISRPMEITAEEYDEYAPPQDIEMIYMPTKPTICNRFPVPAHTCCANCMVMVISPSVSVMGLLFNWWSGAHGFVLVVYLCIVSCWCVSWVRGKGEIVEVGFVMTAPSALPSASEVTNPAAQPTGPGVSTFEHRQHALAMEHGDRWRRQGNAINAMQPVDSDTHAGIHADNDSTVVIGQVLDGTPDPEVGIPVVHGHVVIPRPLGAPLLPRSLTAGRGRLVVYTDTANSPWQRAVAAAAGARA